MLPFVRRAILAVALLAGAIPALAQAPPPVPALPDTERRTSYNISASTCACSVGFALFGDGADYQNWVEVYVNGVMANYNDGITGWTITSPTGPLANLPRPITDALLKFNSPQTGTVQIVGARRPRRVSQFSENAGIPARNVNQVVTDIIAMLREVWDKINNVTGRVVRAPPGETMSTLPPAANRASMGACFDSGGNLAPCVGAPSGSFSPGNGVTFTGTSPTTISTSTFAAGTGIAFTGSNPTVISAGSTSNGALFIPSRAAATSLDLHTYGVIKTGGYATPGDGGETTFLNVGAGPLIDRQVTAYTISRAGTGCTNGTYYGVAAAGGSGQTHSAGSLVAVVTIAGNVMTAIDYTYSPGQHYTVGDVLTFSVPGCTANPQITVSALSAPLGSFVDAVGTNWQIVPGYQTDVRQFGAFTSNTDSFANLQAAFYFARYSPNTLAQSDGGGRVVIPNGVYTACGSGLVSLEVPQGVNVYGSSNQSAEINACGTFSSNVHFIVLCDPNWHYACFGATLNDLVVNIPLTNAWNTGFAAIFSNNDQDMGGLYRTYVYGGLRTCVQYTQGYGGASSFHLWKVSCSAASQNPQIFLQGPIGSTVVDIDDIVLGGPSSGGTYQTGAAVFYGGGLVNINGGHFEATPIGVQVSNTAAISSGMISIHNFNGGSSSPAPACTGIIQLDAGNTPGNMIASMVPQAASCTNTITNGQGAGTNFTGTVSKPVTCPASSACS